METFATIWIIGTIAGAACLIRGASLWRRPKNHMGWVLMIVLTPLAWWIWILLWAVSAIRHWFYGGFNEEEVQHVARSYTEL